MLKYIYVMQKTEIYRNRIFKEHTCNLQVMEDRGCRNSTLFMLRRVKVTGFV